VRCARPASSERLGLPMTTISHSCGASTSSSPLGRSSARSASPSIAGVSGSRCIRWAWRRSAWSRAPASRHRDTNPVCCGDIHLHQPTKAALSPTIEAETAEIPIGKTDQVVPPTVPPEIALSEIRGQDILATHNAINLNQHWEMTSVIGYQGAEFKTHRLVE
jgi:hypothetical protein